MNDRDVTRQGNANNSVWAATFLCRPPHLFSLSSCFVPLALSLCIASSMYNLVHTHHQNEYRGEERQAGLVKEREGPGEGGIINISNNISVLGNISTSILVYVSISTTSISVFVNISNSM